MFQSPKAQRRFVNESANIWLKNGLKTLDEKGYEETGGETTAAKTLRRK
jgi:hypothetical protein